MMRSKKIISLLLVVAILATTINFNNFKLSINRSNALDYRTLYNDEMTMEIGVPNDIPNVMTFYGKLYPLNKGFLFNSGITSVPKMKYGIIVFGKPEDKDVNGSGDFRKGEYRYLGYDLKGNKFTNPDFPNDYDSRRFPSSKNWQNIYDKDLEEKSEWFYNDKLQCEEWLSTMIWTRKNENGKIEYDPIKASTMIQYTKPYHLANKFHILTAPTEYTMGVAKGWHKTIDGKLWYQTFLIPPTEQLKPKPIKHNIVADFTATKSAIFKIPFTYYMYKINGAWKAEEFNVTNKSTIDGIDWKQWAESNSDKYEVTANWSGNKNILSYNLAENGGKVQCLDAGEEKLKLTITVRKKDNSYNDNDDEEKNIKVVKQDLVGILTISTNQAKIGETFTVSTENSIPSIGHKFIPEKTVYEMGTSLSNFEVIADKNVMSFDMSHSKEEMLYFRATLEDTNGSVVTTNIGVIDIVDDRKASASARIQAKETFYEGVFGWIRNRSTYELDGDTYSALKAYDEGFGDSYIEFYRDDNGDKVIDHRDELDFSDYELDEFTHEEGGFAAFDFVGTVYIEDNERPRNGNEDKMMIKRNVLPTPHAGYTVTGTNKEYRKIIIEDDSIVHRLYNLDSSKTALKVTRKDTGESTTITSSSNKILSWIKAKRITSSKIEFLVVNEGEYRIEYHVEDTRGKTGDIQGTVIVYEDKEPEFDLFIDRPVIRYEGIGHIQGDEDSFSPDEDFISPRELKKIHDTNNNGSYQEPQSNITLNGDGSFDIPVNEVGKRQLKYKVIEDFGQPTIPELLVSGEGRKYKEKTEIVDVVNLAPISSLSVVKEMKIDNKVLVDFNNKQTVSDKFNQEIEVNLSDELTGVLVNAKADTEGYIDSTEVAVKVAERNIEGSLKVIKGFDYLYNIRSSSDQIIEIRRKEDLELVGTKNAINPIEIGRYERDGLIYFLDRDSSGIINGNIIVIDLKNGSVTKTKIISDTGFTFNNITITDEYLVISLREDYSKYHVYKFYRTNFNFIYKHSIGSSVDYRENTAKYLFTYNNKDYYSMYKRVQYGENWIMSYSKFNQYIGKRDIEVYYLVDKTTGNFDKFILQDVFDFDDTYGDPNGTRLDFDIWSHGVKPIIIGNYLYMFVWGNTGAVSSKGNKSQRPIMFVNKVDLATMNRVQQKMLFRSNQDGLGGSSYSKTLEIDEVRYENNKFVLDIEYRNTGFEDYSTNNIDYPYATWFYGEANNPGMIDALKGWINGKPYNVYKEIELELNTSLSITGNTVKNMRFFNVFYYRDGKSFGYTLLDNGEVFTFTNILTYVNRRKYLDTYEKAKYGSYNEIEKTYRDRSISGVGFLNTQFLYPFSSNNVPLVFKTIKGDIYFSNAYQNYFQTKKFAYKYNQSVLEHINPDWMFFSERLGKYLYVSDSTKKTYKVNEEIYELINNINSMSFRDNSQKYITIISQKLMYYESSHMNELVNLVNNKNIEIIFFGNSNTQSFGQELISKTKGVYYNFSSYDDSAIKTKQYLKTKLQSGTELKNDTIYLEVGEEFNLKGYYKDIENDPMDSQLFKITSGAWNGSDAGWATTPQKSFSVAGTYYAGIKHKDKPSSNTTLNNAYAKWSNPDVIKIIVGGVPQPVTPISPDIRLSIISSDGENVARQKHRADFIVTGIEGTYPIDWSSLNITFSQNDYLPYIKPSTTKFSRVFTNTGSHNVTISLKDTKGNVTINNFSFTVNANEAPIANFNIQGDGRRNPLGIVDFDIENLASPRDDNIDKIEYYMEIPKYVDNGDGSKSESGTTWVNANMIGNTITIQDKVGILNIKQVVTEKYSNGTGLAGEKLDDYRDFKSSEIIKSTNIINEVPTATYSVSPGIIQVGESVSHDVDYEDDTDFGETIKYKIVHNHNVLQNSNGLHPLHNQETDEATEVLNYKGIYDFYIQVEDEDRGNTGWIYGGQVKVVTKPVADFDLLGVEELEEDVFKSGTRITINNKASNEDYGNTTANQGISYMKIEYRNKKDNNYITAFELDNIPNYIFNIDVPLINEIGIYEVKQTIRSVDDIEATKIKEFQVLELRLFSELEPSTIYASQSYKIKATVSKDAEGVVAKVHNGNWISLDKASEDADNRYYEKEISTLETLPDGTYNIEVYGIYPFGNEVRDDLTLTVDTSINLTSDIKPLGPSEYTEVIEENPDNDDYIRIPAGEKIKVEAEVTTPIGIDYVKATLEGETETILTLNTSTYKYEGEVLVPDVKADRDYYDLVIETRIVNGNIEVNTHRVRVDTPIDLGVTALSDLVSDTDMEIKATTTKYANSTKANLYKDISNNGTLYTMTEILASSLRGSKKDWNTIHYIKPTIPEGDYLAEFISYTPNGNSETVLVPIKVINIKLENLRIVEIRDYAWKDYFVDGSDAVTTLSKNGIQVKDMPIYENKEGNGIKLGYKLYLKINSTGLNEIGDIIESIPKFYAMDESNAITEADIYVEDDNTGDYKLIEFSEYRDIAVNVILDDGYRHQSEVLPSELSKNTWIFSYYIPPTAKVVKKGEALDLINDNTKKFKLLVVMDIIGKKNDGTRYNYTAKEMGWAADIGSIYGSNRPTNLDLQGYGLSCGEVFYYKLDETLIDDLKLNREW